MGASKALAEWAVEAAQNRYRGHPLRRGAVRQRARLVRLGGADLPPPDRGRRAGHGHRREDVALLHDDPRGGAAHHPLGDLLPVAAPRTAAPVADARAAPQARTYVLEMGDPVKIVDLARNMIRLSGKEPDVDIAIEIVGRRPGEKIHEELFEPGERPQPTPGGEDRGGRAAAAGPRVGGGRVRPHRGAGLQRRRLRARRAPWPSCRPSARSPALAPARARARRPEPDPAGQGRSPHYSSHLRFYGDHRADRVVRRPGGRRGPGRDVRALLLAGAGRQAPARMGRPRARALGRRSAPQPPRVVAKPVPKPPGAQAPAPRLPSPRRSGRGGRVGPARFVPQRSPPQRAARPSDRGGADRGRAGRRHRRGAGGRHGPGGRHSGGGPRGREAPASRSRPLPPAESANGTDEHAVVSQDTVVHPPPAAGRRRRGDGEPRTARPTVPRSRTTSGAPPDADGERAGRRGRARASTGRAEDAEDGTGEQAAADCRGRRAGGRRPRLRSGPSATSRPSPAACPTPRSFHEGR